MVMTPMAKLTGGEDGFTGIPKLEISFPLHLDLTNNMSLYYFVFVVAGLAFLAVQRIISSPFGHVLSAIRENEERISACGYNTVRMKLLSLIFSGCFSALAGGLYTVYLGYVPVSTLFWLLSGSILMMTLLGGTKVFVGADHRRGGLPLSAKHHQPLHRPLAVLRGRPFRGHRAPVPRRNHGHHPKAARLAQELLIAREKIDAS